MLFSKCSPVFGASVAVVALVGSGAKAQTFVGGGDAPTYNTSPPVSIVAHSGDAGGGREVVNTINGSGMLSKVTDDRQPVTTMALFRNFPVGGPYIIPPNPTGLAGSSNWVEYDLGSVVPLQEVWIWNWNERADTTPDNTRFGWQFAAIQWSTDGLAWSSALNVVIPQSDASTGSAVDLIAPIGAQARYVVLANQGVGPTLTYGGDDGVNDAGLSEVRFSVPEPASLGFLSFAGVALLRRRK